MFCCMESIKNYENPADCILRSWRSFTVAQESLEPPQVVSFCNTFWSSMADDYVRVSVDGAVERVQSRAGCGGVIWNKEGHWIAGFSHFLGACTAFEAEEWALLKGLNLAWELGFRKVLIESDAKELVSLLVSIEADRLGSLLLRRIKEFFNRNWEVCVRSIPREANRVADSLAKKGLNTSEFYDACPDFVRLELTHENLGSNPPMCN